MASGLTPAQAACLDAIRRLTAGGVPPSLEELRRELGLGGKCTVHRLLGELRARGVVDWIPAKARTLRVLDDQFSREDLARMSDAALERVIHEAGELLDGRRAS